MKTAEDESGLLYIPSPAVSEAFQTEFNKIVRMSPNGFERMLRFAWGMDRLEFANGFWFRRYPDTDNVPAKYVGRERWVVEGWQSPDVFDREEWEKQEALLGPFPENGVWDFIEYHETENEQFLPLDNSALERARSWAMWQSKGTKRSLEFLTNQKMQKLALNMAIRREKADAVAEEFGEAWVKAEEKLANPMTTHGPDIARGFKPTESGLLVPNN